ncbi:MAG: FAD-dependent oxidoreductase [Gemmatimonadetes bacterium]|nr:FAD-dependent oxidoreductase [Gemmatimonadota bacterium]
MANLGGGVGVVGAGPAGLAAAWRLRAAGHRVTVYEAGPAPGGRLRTEEVGDTAADVAVQLLSDGYDRLLEMAADLDAASLLVRVPGRDALWRGDRAHRLRYGSVTGMAASGALPASLKLRMGLRYVPFLERNAAALDLNDPGRAAAAGLDAESIAEWGRRELGDDFVELLVYPLLAAYYGVTPEETSAGFFHALARAGMRVNVLGAWGGARALAERLAAGLRTRGVTFRTAHAIARLDARPAGVTVEAAGGSAGHDAVVVAVPAGEAARLLPGFEWLEGVRARPTAALVLATTTDVRTGWFGLSIPRTELKDTRLATICVQAEKETGVTRPGRGALVLIPTPAEAPSWVAGEPRDVLARALPDLDRVLPGVRERVTEARLVRFPAGGFVPYPGYLSRIAAFGAASSALPERVALAGDYLVAPTVEGAVRAGIAAADRLSPVGW